MEILSSRSEKKESWENRDLCTPSSRLLQSSVTLAGSRDVPPPSVSFLLSIGAGSHAAQSIIIARCHIVYIIMFLTNFN